jgi:hypothetical protein
VSNSGVKISSFFQIIPWGKVSLFWRIRERVRCIPL